jgi:hypothetical protein
MGLQRVDTDATEAIEIIRKEGLSIPVRALNTVVLFISHRLRCKIYARSRFQVRG